ncbi:SIALI-17 repeat-containing surface protein [Granulicatella sp.]
MNIEKGQKFAIRKFSVGVASVLIGQFFIGAVANAPVVHASEKEQSTSATVNQDISTLKLNLTEAQPVEVEYKADDSIELGKRNELITETGKKIITIGTKPTTVVEEISPIITYQEDKELEGGTTREEESNDPTHNGKISTITHTYNVNLTTGEVTDIQSEPVLTDSGKKGKIIHVGTKKVTRTETVNKYIYEGDDSKEYDDMIWLHYHTNRYELTYEITFQYNSEKHLAEGNKKLIKTEEIQRTLGEDVKRTVIPDNKISTEIIKVKTGPKVTATKTGKKRYHYIAQPEREAGESSIVKKAIPLIREKVDYYKVVNKYSGTVEHTHSAYRTKREMEFGVVEIGTKPKVVDQEIPIFFKVDNKLVDSGKKLPVKTIVHYTLPENYEETEKLEEDITNEVLPFTVKKEESGKYSVHFDKKFEKPQVAEKPIYIADETLESGKRTETVDEKGRKVIKIGTKSEEVVIEEIPPANIYEEDKNLDGGEIREEEITDSSRNGKIKSVKYTYEINTETGELIMHESEPIIKDSGKKAKKVYVGTKTTTKVYSHENKLYFSDPTKYYFEPEPPRNLFYGDNPKEIEVHYKYDSVNHKAVITSWGNNLEDYVKVGITGRIVHPVYTKPYVEALPGIKRYKYILNESIEAGQMTVVKESKPLIINEIWYKNEPIPNKTLDDKIHERYEIKQEGEDGVIEIGSKPKVYTKTITVNVEQNGKIIQKEVQVKITIRYSLENEYSPKLIKTITSEIEPIEIEEPKVTSEKPKDAPTNEVPEYTGGVNSAEPPIHEVPVYRVKNKSFEQEESPQKQAVVYKTNTTTENENSEPKFDEKNIDKTIENSIQGKGKFELPKTGTKDNITLTSLGFLGLMLGTMPLLKKKSK